MGFNYGPPKLNLPEYTQVFPSDELADILRDRAQAIRASLKPDEDFVCEYFTGGEVITVIRVGRATRETVRLIGFDALQRECEIVAHVSRISLLFRISKKTTPNNRSYGFTVDSNQPVDNSAPNPETPTKPQDLTPSADLP
jgi:hypothetical protein